MADFIKSYNITMKHEGLYSNDKDDFGGETYKGISKKYHPSWDGWEIIDTIKNEVFGAGFSNHRDEYTALNNSLSNSAELDSKVKLFYKQSFWDVFLGDFIKSQIIANELFDTSVNMGSNRAIAFLQMGLNVLNKAEKLYKNITVDGKMGQKTLDTLNMLLSIPGEDLVLYKVLNILQGNHYINQMLKTESQEKFARGWLSRVDIIKC